jgi:hypothetical protein
VGLGILEVRARNQPMGMLWNSPEGSMAFSIIVVALLPIVFYHLVLKGNVGNFSGGIGNAFFQVHTFLGPTTHSIVEAKKQRRQEAKQADGDDDDKPPELAPGAQSGD